jgi:nucleoside-diphosphate-sugar epimerase
MPSPIVITGARGFIATAVASSLSRNGHEVRRVSREQGEGFVAADLGTAGAWDELIADADAVIHLSTRMDLVAGERDPKEDAHINVTPVRELIGAIERVGRRDLPVVFASTVTIVGDRHTNPVSEVTADNPITSYDRNKQTCERLLRDANLKGHLRACSLRLANVYGPGVASRNSSRGVLNAMMRRALRRETLTVYGTGDYLRDFIHIDDVTEAFRLALATPTAWNGGHYIISRGEGWSLKDAFSLVAHEAAALTGIAVDVACVPEPETLHPIERRSFVGDPRLFASLTGWMPRIGLEQGVRSSLRYFCSEARARELS